MTISPARHRRLWAGSVLLGLCAAAWIAATVARRIERRAARTLDPLGIQAEKIRFHWLGPLRLHGVTASAPGGGRLNLESVDVAWRLGGGRDVRAHIRAVTLRGLRLERARLTALWPEARFDVVSWRRDGGTERLKLRQPGAAGGQLELTWPPEDDEPVLALSRLDLAAMDVHWNKESVVRPGRWTGRVQLVRGGPHLESEGAFHGEAMRLVLPKAIDADRQRGEPTDVTLEWAVCRDGRAVEIDRFAVRFDGLDLTLRGKLAHAGDRDLDLALSARSELAAAFRTVGLPPPVRDARADTFGRAWLDLSLKGPFDEPETLEVKNSLRFEVTPEVERALAYLRGPFRHKPDGSPGVVIDVRAGALDFISIDAVPPLFRRALLIAEDPAYSSHKGIDVGAIVAAWAYNTEEGRVVRGGSTLTQQLVKNLMLSPERTYGRKLEEAALALMVDAVVPKPRQLEIYVNIIEWGPRLYGLVPAARHYFGKRPEHLTVKEIAFLVSVIPSPMRHHEETHAAGRVGPDLEEQIQNLLGRLGSLGVVTEDEREAARYEALRFAPESAS
jgi:hypothetical protein